MWIFFSRQVLEVDQDGGCCEGLCSAWFSAARGVGDRFCTSLSDGRCGTAICSGRWQVWTQHGGESVARNVQTHCWHSGTFFLLLLRLRLLLSPSAFSKATDDRVYTLGCAELNCFILPGKNRAGADGSQRKRERA